MVIIKENTTFAGEKNWKKLLVRYTLGMDE